MNSTQSLQKRPQEIHPGGQSGQLSAVDPVEAHPLPASHLQTCASCDAPLDALQRYCLNCGTRSTYVSNPAVDYLSQKITVSSRGASRLVPKSEAVGGGIGGTGVNKQAVPWLIGATLLALIVGVFIGSRNGNDELAKAIANQKAPVVNVNGGSGGGPSAATATPLTSDFTLEKGYTVQVATIPSTSDQTAATTAKTEATTKGAKNVGLINPTDFTLTPAPAATDYVIFSGQFKKKSDAQATLKKLKAKFPDAKLLSVTAAAGAGTPTDAADTQDLSKFKPSEKKLKEDSTKVKALNNKKGDDYVKAQDDLDPVTAIPEDPNANADPNALPGGD